MFSKPSSATLATNIAGLAVIRHSGFSTACSSLLKAMRAHRPGLGRARRWHFSSTSTRRCASLSLPDLADLDRSARRRLLDGGQVGQAELGLDHLDVGDRVDLAGDVDHVLVVEAAHDVDDRVGLADVGEELVAQALALDAPATRPAMSTNSTIAGTMRSGLTIAASCRRRGSGSSTTPTFGSMVQNG